MQLIYDSLMFHRSIELPSLRHVVIVVASIKLLLVKLNRLDSQLSFSFPRAHHSQYYCCPTALDGVEGYPLLDF